jgi:hypothetical protein
MNTKYEPVKLSQVIENLIAAANAAPLREQKRSLSRGLWMAVTRNRDESYHLRI